MSPILYQLDHCTSYTSGSKKVLRLSSVVVYLHEFAAVTLQTPPADRPNFSINRRNGELYCEMNGLRQDEDVGVMLTRVVY